MKIPSYPKHYDYDIDDLLHSVKNVVDAVDGVSLFTLMGGEPFLYPNLREVIDFLKGSMKVANIRIVTNGTIIPDESVINSLIGTKILVCISDYGALSHKKEDLKIILTGKNIHFEEWKFSDAWIDMEDFDPNKSEAEIRDGYAKCMLGNPCKSLLNGRLYPCFRAATLTNLCLKDEDKSEFVELKDDSALNVRGEIKRLLQETSLSSCRYCGRIGGGGKRITPAIQAIYEKPNDTHDAENRS
jgi:MoaA/NifB/PqqE/SkfB family radical SAM enzyme